MKINCSFRFSSLFIFLSFYIASLSAIYGIYDACSCLESDVIHIFILTGLYSSALIVLFKTRYSLKEYLIRLLQIALFEFAIFSTVQLNYFLGVIITIFNFFVLSITILENKSISEAMEKNFTIIRKYNTLVFLISVVIIYYLIIAIFSIMLYKTNSNILKITKDITLFLYDITILYFGFKKYVK